MSPAKTAETVLCPACARHAAQCESPPWTKWGFRMHDDIQRLLTAARVPETPHSQTFGLWRIRRAVLSHENALRVGWLTQTRLERYTLAVEMAGQRELVMEDSRRELSRHLP